jgi:hypothetical protein
MPNISNLRAAAGENMTLSTQWSNQATATLTATRFKLFGVVVDHVRFRVGKRMMARWWAKLPERAELQGARKNPG